MHKIVLLLMYGLLLLFYSCSDKEMQTHSEKEFGDVIQLNTKRKFTRELLSIDDLMVKDSLVVICNSRDDSIFMAFDLKGKDTLNCVKTWGRKGKGPGEYGLFTHLIDLPQNEFYVADYSRNNLRKYSLPEFKLRREKKIVTNRDEPQFREIPQKIVSPDGSIFFYDKFMMHELYITRWKNGQTPEEIFGFPSFKKQYSKETSTTYFGCLAVNSKMNRIVYAFHHFRRFYIMDFDGNIIKKVQITPGAPSPVFKDDRNLDAGSSTLCFMNARATDRSIFLYYVGHTYNEIKKKDWQVSTYIEEYDWEGNPINRYKLDRFISNFDIVSGKKGSRFFLGIDQAHEDPVLVLKKD